MSISILIYIILAFIVVILIWILYTERRLRNFFAGTKAKNLEDVMIKLGKGIEKVNKSQVVIEEHLKINDSRLNKSIRNVRAIRFNPFIDAGGNQSFAISFLNDLGNGVIISSLYARDRMSIFAKPIEKGKSKFELTDEEREVLEQSK